tara:strand:+ start:787 stop:1611 length:825 start_codon:yes stop_codon:yes gene_type:complete
MASGFNIDKDFTISSHVASGSVHLDASGSSAQYTLGNDWGHPNNDYTTIGEVFNVGSMGGMHGYDQIVWDVSDSMGMLSLPEASTTPTNYALKFDNGLPRFFKTKAKMNKNAKITFRHIAGSYQESGGGLALEKPAADSDLLVQYSTDGVSWVTLVTYAAATYNSDAGGMPAWTSVIINAVLPDAAYIRITQTTVSSGGDGGTSKDHWAIDDVYIKHHDSVLAANFDVLGGGGRKKAHRRKDIHVPFLIQDSPIARLHVRSKGRTAKGYKSTIG